MRAVVEYDGTAFYGMQVQPSIRTVGGELERVFSKLLQHPVKITSAGRTDAGVHASGQVVSFKTEAAFPFERFAIAANSELPRDVSVRRVEIARSDFSARFGALERTYVYAIHAAAEPAPLLSRYAWHNRRRFDLDAFREGARHLIGEHDFRSFCGMLPESGPTIRTVRVIEAKRSGRLIRIEIRAGGFLHRMVRTIVGTLAECASGRRDPAQMPHILAARDRSAAGLTAPAQGLYLAGVLYADGFDSFAEPPLTAAFAYS